jgi:hypothetical protein
MATVNKRILQPQAITINGIDAGGAMTAQIQKGYDQFFESAPDGLQIPIIDRCTQFCRGSFVSQDWTKLVSLLTGTLGTYVFYERKSGAALATGFVKHSLLNPLVHKASLSLSSGDKSNALATLSSSFECRAGDETDALGDLHVMLDSQPAPTHIAAARGGIRIVSCALGALAIYHATRLSLDISIPLFKASNDGDVAYTAVDADLNGMSVSGSLSFQDATITAARLKCDDLAVAARGSLVTTIRQAGGAANKILTIAGVIFGSSDQSAGQDYDEFTMPFRVSNDATTQLTLAGANKIITLADAV